VKRHAPRLAARQRGILAFMPLTVVGPGRLLALLWQIIHAAARCKSIFGNAGSAAAVVGR
jgi:hypothetical protein